jgi:hypothetical protein
MTSVCGPTVIVPPAAPMDFEADAADVGNRPEVRL